MAANNLSNIHVSPKAILSLMPLQQENLRKLQQFCRTAALKRYAEFKGKHPCWSFFLTKMQAGGT